MISQLSHDFQPEVKVAPLVGNFWSNILKMHLSAQFQSLSGKRKCIMEIMHLGKAGCGKDALDCTGNKIL